MMSVRRKTAGMCRIAMLVAMFAWGSALVARAEDAVQNPTELAKLKESLAKWEALKKESGESYEYYVKFTSWTGFSSSTHIIVLKGKVVHRTYSETNAREGVKAEIRIGPDGEAREVVKQPEGKIWTEDPDEIGTHKEGAPAKSIDALYAEAAEILRSKSPEHNRITLLFHDNGLLRLCLFAEKNCADDCSQGVRIEDFGFVQ